MSGQDSEVSNSTLSLIDPFREDIFFSTRSSSGPFGEYLPSILEKTTTRATGLYLCVGKLRIPRNNQLEQQSHHANKNTQATHKNHDCKIPHPPVDTCVRVAGRLDDSHNMRIEIGCMHTWWY